MYRLVYRASIVGRVVVGDGGCHACMYVCMYVGWVDVYIVYIYIVLMMMMMMERAGPHPILPSSPSTSSKVKLGFLRLLSIHPSIHTNIHTYMSPWSPDDDDDHYAHSTYLPTYIPCGE